MKVALFNTVPYLDVADKGMSVNPPVPSGWFDAEVGARSLRRGLELFELADQLGFDWVSLAEHHYSPRQMTPNPLLMAAALSQRLKHVQIAILGSLLPLNNPIRLAEEYAMLDLLTEGRLVVGLLRGTAPEYVTYGANPLESRERYAEGVELMLRAWSEPMPFGWEEPLLSVPHGLDLATAGAGAAPTGLPVWQQLRVRCASGAPAPEGRTVVHTAADRGPVGGAL